MKISNENVDVVLIGGAVFDIKIKPLADKSYSTPADKQETMGGVARNIAENLSNLKTNVSLIAAFSKDNRGKSLAKYCASKNICLDHSKIDCNDECAEFFYISNQNDVILSGYSTAHHINQNNLTKGFMRYKMDHVNSAKICVIDANVPLETIKYIVQKCTVPIYAAGVSKIKSTKFSCVLEHLDFLHINIDEAQNLSKREITNLYDMKFAAQTLIDKGVKNVFISHSDGIYFKNSATEGFIKKLAPKLFKSNIGVNNAFDAGVIFAISKGVYDLDELSKYGLVASSISASTSSAVNPDINEDVLLDLLKEENFEHISLNEYF